ncbi:MAG: phytanoyl-CoA dioxygenase [Rhodospirillaceae bacterium]|nr:phytanoyl-CoA dioxygenase [Rhodospirillaceae bacterium]|tara:strand:+ start:659 stop:1477 length:819 start_codon:yes stop_codon:yes gene_type:complete
MTGTILKDVNAKTSRQWREDGVILIKEAFSVYWLDILVDGIEQAMENPSPIARDYIGESGGRFFTDHHMCRRIEAFRRFEEESNVTELAAKIMRTEKLNYVDEHLLVKEPGTENKTHWHQDLPYYEIGGPDFGSFWIPLDAVDENSGALRFVKGSHRSGKIYQPVRIAEGVLVEEADQYDGPVPNIDENPDLYEVVSYNMLPGDALFFHAGVLHAAFPNKTTTRRRRALSTRYAGSESYWQPRPYVPAANNTQDLEEGGPLDSEAYPVVWRN